MSHSSISKKRLLEYDITTNIVSLELRLDAFIFWYRARHIHTDVFPTWPRCLFPLECAPHYVVRGTYREFVPI